MAVQPLRDDGGSVVPHDHPEIEDTDEVIRRISEEFLVTLDSGRRRISSMAYRGSSIGSGGMSVDVKSFIEADGVDPIEWVMTPRWLGSVVFQVSSLRQLGFKVGYNPIFKGNKMGVPPNPYHGEVWGTFSRARQKQLKKLASWFVSIPDVDL